jgi:hypothetical protein
LTYHVSALLRKPSAWLPFVISLAALAFVLGYVGLFGVVDNQDPHDEGGPARLFQLVMLAEAVVIAFFAVRWMPQAPKQAALIIALQIMVASLPIATVVILES